MLTTYYKGSNLLGFNTTLQKFWDMICEIIFCKTVSGISWFFVVLVNILHAVTVLINLFAQINWIDFFFQKYFFNDVGFFFKTEKPLIWVSFFAKKMIFYFFQLWLFNFNAIFKTCVKIYWEKLKKGDFTLLNKSLEPNKLL